MRASARHLGLLAALAAGAACATLAARHGAPSAQDVIRLPHVQHRAAGIECQACHARAYSATTLDARLLPEEKVCLKCHGEWKEQGRCELCHLTASPQSYPPYEPLVNVSHLDHLARVDNNCRRCHSDLPEPGVGVERWAPMGTCLACHNHKEEYEQARCTPCHHDLTQVPLRPVAYFTHQGDYLKGHATPARAAPEACAQCHEQSFCADCHARTAPTTIELKFPEKVERQMLHQNDFESRHALEARADAAMCLRCHSPLSCDRCHRERGVEPAAPNPRDPHPAGWAMPGSARFHGTAARRDIASCASCHDQGAASNCVGCHKVGGIGGSPHPPSFFKRRDAQDIARSPTCRACHP